MKIEDPCTQNYSSMPLKGNGRHCSHCDKVVVDFRRMSDEQLKTYFVEHAAENICGKVRSYQVNEHNAFTKHILSFKNFISEKINFSPLKLALLALVSALMTFTTSCMGKMMPPQKPDPHAKDTVDTNKKVNERK